MRPNWRATEPNHRYERSDGAVVKLESLYSGYWNAYAPNCGQYDYLFSLSKRRLKRPRRWRSAEAAMKLLDRDYPLTQAAQ